MTMPYTIERNLRPGIPQDPRFVGAAVKERREAEGYQWEREEGVAAAEVSAEVTSPVTFVPHDLPIATVGVGIPSSILQDIEASGSIGDSSPESFIDIPSGTVSPTLSISTVSDPAPTELGEGIECGEQQAATCHDTLCFEDGRDHSLMLQSQRDDLGSPSQTALRILRPC